MAVEDGGEAKEPMGANLEWRFGEPFTLGLDTIPVDFADAVARRYLKGK